ncbi:hypothetical protein [Xanthomonas fragariae]|nr:hypothetical protein [Xanthomonas fragariae]UKR51958.1 hypothetical protein K4A87_14825 [Xanthomonas fragariae]
MRELTENEIEKVDGGLSDFTEGGMAVIAIGFAGGSMLVVGHYQTMQNQP